MNGVMTGQASGALIAGALASFLPTAAAMGATFPIAASWFAERVAVPTQRASARSSAEAGNLYAANTAGAAAGAIAAGFWLIPAVGVRGTTWIGVALNAAAAIGALWLARADTRAPVAADRSEVRPAIQKDKDHKSSKRQQALHHRGQRPADPQPVLAGTAVALSGFVALVFEVAFTRLLALVIGPTTYAFATMAASFITGLALGSAAGARLSRKVSRPAYWLAATLAITAIGGSLAASYAASQLPLVVASEVAAASATFESVVLRQAVDVALLLLPLTFALGAAFPLALATASGGTSGRTESVATDAARTYVANTLGAICGSIAAGFLLVPRFGLQATFHGTSRAAMAGAVAIAGFAALGGRARPTTSRLAVIGGLSAAGVLVAFLIDLEIDVAFRLLHQKASLPGSLRRAFGRPCVRDIPQMPESIEQLLRENSWRVCVLRPTLVDSPRVPTVSRKPFRKARRTKGCLHRYRLTANGWRTRRMRLAARRFGFARCPDLARPYACLRRADSNRCGRRTAASCTTRSPAKS